MLSALISEAFENTPAGEKLHFVHDENTGLQGVIAIDSLNLGPAMGGCRFWKYETGDKLAEDALRLARGMSYKNALAGLPLGGGKSVLQIPDAPFDRQALFQSFGMAIERLNGNYVTAEDVGTTVADMHSVRQHTRHVAGLTPQSGMAGGDPSPWTAFGVFVAMQQACKSVLQRNLSELTVAIQGAGSVGGKLARMLRAADARIIIADVAHARAEELALQVDGRVVTPAEIVAVDADVFAPCALGGAINLQSLPDLKARLICGAANNQIASEVTAEMLEKSGVAYMPDYLVNAGGIINAAAEYLGETDEQVDARVRAIGDRLAAVLETSAATGRMAHLVADEMAEAILNGTTGAEL